jgi:hypothetical protein
MIWKIVKYWFALIILSILTSLVFSGVFKLIAYYGIVIYAYTKFKGTEKKALLYAVLIDFILATFLISALIAAIAWSASTQYV